MSLRSHLNIRTSITTVHWPCKWNRRSVLKIADFLCQPHQPQNSEISKHFSLATSRSWQVIWNINLFLKVSFPLVHPLYKDEYCKHHIHVRKNVLEVSPVYCLHLSSSVPPHQAVAVRSLSVRYLSNELRFISLLVFWWLLEKLCKRGRGTEEIMVAEDLALATKGAASWGSSWTGRHIGPGGRYEFGYLCKF